MEVGKWTITFMVRLGQKLKELRLQRRQTIDEVAVETKIKPQFLDAIERGEYKELPSAAYAQGFVKNYAEYLGLPKSQIAALFKRDFDEKKAMKVLPDGMTESKGFPLKRINLRRTMILSSIILILVGFLLFQYRSRFIAPHLSINSPKEGSAVGKELEIKGKTDSNAIVTVNNEPVFVDTRGEFVKKITLFPGKTIIVIKAKNRLGKENIINRSITVKQ